MNLFNYIKTNRYYSTIISFYIFIYLYFIFVSKENYFKYSFNNMLESLCIIIISIFILFICIKFLKYGDIHLRKYSLKDSLLLLFYSLFLIAIPEEILFRGIIQGYLNHNIQSIHLPVLLSSIIFGLAHALNDSRAYTLTKWNWKLIILTFIAGLCFGILYTLTDNLLIPVITHSLFIILMKVFIMENKNEIKASNL